MHSLWLLRCIMSSLLFESDMIYASLLFFSIVPHSEELLSYCIETNTGDSSYSISM